MNRHHFAVLLISGMLLVAMAVGMVWFSGAGGPLHEQIPVRIELGQMETRKVEGFDWISLPGCSHISVQGHPALPIKSVVVKLPRNTVLVKISVVKMASVVVPGKYRVAPALKPRVVSDNTETKVVDGDIKSEALNRTSLFSAPLPEIYNSSVPYPSKFFDSYSSKGREYNYVMIYFYPVKFAPLEGGLTLISEATFVVEYAMEAEGALSLDDPSLDQVIITASAYETEANALAGWRNATQVRTSVFTTDWVYSAYGGVDEPEKIRNFIGDMFSNMGIRYVLLFGDVDDVPTRFAYVPDGDDAGGPDGILVPTDYYYECLEGTWDPNGDGKYADLKNDDYTQIDFIPEVSVGRLSVDEATASQVVNKIIEYEKSIDPTWSRKMVLAGTDPFKDYAGAEGEILKDYVEDILQGNFTEFTKLYETLGTLSTSAISVNINLGCGGFDFAGHGNYGLWSLEGAGSYTNNNAAGLTNGYKLPIVAAMACLTAGFDSLYNTGNCIGEEFLRNPNGGNAAYVGATRTAWGYTGTGITAGLAGELDWRFWESYRLGVTQPGPMLTEAKIKYIASHPLNTTYLVKGGYYYLDEKTVLEYVLLGDPVLFAEKPATLVKTYKDLAYLKGSKFFTVNDVVYIEADVRGYGGANISSADVYAGLYVDSGLEANITLSHLGGGSSLYRGSWVSGSSSSIGVYLVNVTVSSPYESASGSNYFHLYSGSGVSAYRLDWDEDGRKDYVLESEHLVSVFDGTEYTDQLIIYLYQKDTDVAYTFGKIADPDSIGKGEITANNMKDIKFYSFSPQMGENLASSYLEIRVNITRALHAQETKVLVVGEDGDTQSADLFNTVLTAAGYTVTQELASATNPATWSSYDILVWAASDDKSPINNGKAATIDALVTYVNGGGHLIIEGGEIGHDATYYNWNAFMSDVLHIYDQWFGDWYDRNAELAVEAPTHLVRTSPNVLPDLILFTFGRGLDYGTADWLATTDGKVIYQWNEYVSGENVNYGEPIFGVMAYDDDNDETNGGQIVFLSFDVRDIDSPTDEADLIENVANWVVPTVTTSFNLTVTMRKGSVDYLVYRVHNFDENISDFSDIFSDIAGTLGSSVGDDRYHLGDGTDGLVTSLTADQWNNYDFSDYVCVYDNSSSVDPVDDVVLAWVRFNESTDVSYEDVGLWNDAGYAAEGLRIRYNASQASATDEITYMLVFTEGDWETVHEWMAAVKSGQFPDPNFARFPPPAVYLLLTVGPSQRTYSMGQMITFTVNVFNQKNYALESTLTLTVTGPSGYYLFDFEWISVAADAVVEYSFSWSVPDVAGTYVVEVSLVPPMLTAYDAVWLEVV